MVALVPFVNAIDAYKWPRSTRLCRRSTFHHLQPLHSTPTQRDEQSAEWDAAMTNVGFAMITGHGVDPAIVDALRQRDSFRRAGGRRAKVLLRALRQPLGGFTAMGVEAVARSRDDHGSDGGATRTTALPDLVESFVFKPEETTKTRVEAPELWHPTRATPYHAALLKVLDALHRVTAAALGLEEDFFAPFYAPSAKCSLRLAYYPPLSTTQQTSSAVRYGGAHTDYTGEV